MGIHSIDKKAPGQYHEAMSTPSGAQAPPPARRVFCNRTLNLRAIRAFGFDMDYTLIHYHADEWEERAFSHLKRKLLERTWPVAHLKFEPQMFQRGLFIDRQLGNIVKANQFGYIKRASHGTKMLDFDDQRKLYSETIVDPSEERFVFLNTLFSISEANMYARLVELLDAGSLPEVLGYADLFDLLRRSYLEAHMEGKLKSEICSDPEHFVVLDEDTPLTLLDLHQAGNILLLITNSDWTYTKSMMSYAFDRFLPGGMAWRDLFDVIIVSSRKPAFFTTRQPFFEVVDEGGLLSPVVGVPERGKALVGGHAAGVEEMLDLHGSQFLYIGDHAYYDVHISKNIRRWRTGLILRELEAEIEAIESFRPRQKELTALMREKEVLENRLAQLRITVQRHRIGRDTGGEADIGRLENEIEAARRNLLTLDERITPLAIAASELRNERWGLLMRTGNDKSYMASMVERFADIYTSRVSNLIMTTPFAFFRAHRTLLPHDDDHGPGSD